MNETVSRAQLIDYRQSDREAQIIVEDFTCEGRVRNPKGGVSGEKETR